MDSPANSPYVVGMPVIGEHFFGRKMQIEQFFRRLSDVQPQPMRVLGLRRSGKTSYLRHISNCDETKVWLNHKKHPTIIAYVNLQRVKTTNDFCREVAIAIHEVKPSLGKRPGHFAGIGSLLIWLEKIFNINKTMRCVVLLDEVDLLASHSCSDFDATFFRTLRAMACDSLLGRFIWVTSSCNDLYAISQQLKEPDKTSPFWNIFHPTPIVIGGMTEHEAGKLITEPARLGNILVEQEEVDSILSIAGTLPYFTQMVAENFYLLKKKGGKGSDRSPDNVIEKIMNNGFIGNQFWAYWNSLLIEERNYLSKIAHEITSLKLGHKIESNLIDYGLIREAGNSSLILNGELLRTWMLDVLSTGPSVSHPHTGITTNVYMNDSASKRFAIALSFPSEYRDFVVKVADYLADAVTTERVLYDKFWEAEFARLDLDVYLPNLYRNESELVVIFLCPEYKKKHWCRLEWRYIKQLIATIEQDRIMLLSFNEPGDMTDHGILPGDGCIDIGSRQTDEIAALILQRHALYVPPISTTAQAPQQADRAWNQHSSYGQKNKSTGVTREDHFQGKQRSELVNFFASNWLLNGPAVAILQGFPGSGKTQLARAVAENAARSSVQGMPQSESPDPSTSLLTDLAVTLGDKGIADLQQEMDRGPNGDLFNVLLKVLCREKILIIIDEFQRFFADIDTYPPKRWQLLVEDLNNSPSPNGRLMLISNRSIAPARWCESCVTRTLGGLTDAEAAAFLHELLESLNLTAKVPTERLEEIGHRLGGNPRALKTLVVSLRYDSLEDLISLAPDLFKPGDVEIAPALVENFERELIKRALPFMDGDLLKFMRCLAVHRRPFTKEAFAEFTGTSVPPPMLRKQLIDRFLWENTPGWDCLHPLAREISVSRLRTEKEEWRQAHNLAANYHFRHFKARQIGGTQKLTASYSELRHHLLEAGRIDELNMASEKLTKFALSQITKPAQSQVPDNVETLEERIALISALPDKQRPKGLEYHLALCLKHRNIGDDYQKALYHVRKATGRSAYYAVWLLRLDLEYALNGIDAMLKTQAEALRHLGAGSNAFSIYLRSAQILEKDNKLNDAIKVLEKGIDTPGVTCLAPLISQCAEYMEQAEKYHDAIRILKKGIDTPEMPELVTLYKRCANLMAKTNCLDDAISLLKKGVNTLGMTKLYSIYLLMAEFMEKDGKSEEAIDLLKEGISNPIVRDPIKLYRLCAELLVKNRRIEEANTLIESGIASKVIKDPVPLYHFFAELMEKSGNAEDGVKLLKSAIANRQMMSEPTLYLSCATLLFHSINLEDAIGVLKRGLLVPQMKDQWQLYQMCSDLMGRQGYLGDAIELLEKGIADNNVNNQGSLYQSCSELMVKADRLEDAIDLLKRGINAPAIANKSVLFQACAKLLAKAKRPDEGIELLERAIVLPGMSGMVILYQTCVTLMSNAGRKQEAIHLLKKAIAGPKLGNLGSLYQLCAELMIDTGQRNDAILLLKKGITNYPKDNSLKTLYEKVIEP